MSLVDFIKNRAFKYSLLGSIYLTQGIASLIIFVLLPIYLKNYRGLSDLAIAILAGTSSLPVLLKPIVAVLSDKYPIMLLGGSRKPYMIIGFILNGIALPLIGITDPIDFLYLFGILWTLQSLGMICMDVGIDALITESLKGTKEKLNANIAAYMATVLSILVVIPLAFISEINSIHLGIHLNAQFQFDVFLGGNFNIAFLYAGVICISLILFTLFLKEPEVIQTRPTFSLKDLKTYVNSKHVPTLLLFFFMINIDSGLLEYTLDPFFRISGVTASIQLFYYLPSILFSIFGYLTSKWFIKKGIIKSNIYFAVIFSCFLGISTLLTLSSPNLVPIFYFTSTVVIVPLTNAALVLYITLAMGKADKNMAATTFVLFTTLYASGKIFGILVAGVLPFTGDFKIVLLFLISFFIMICRIPILYRLRVLDHDLSVGKNNENS